MDASALELEAAEKEAAADQCRAAPDELRARLAIGLSEMGGALVTRCERLDLPQFNRVLGLGVTAPASRATVEQVIASYRAAGIKRFAVPLAPEAAPAELRDWLRDLGLAASSRQAKLWRDSSAPIGVLCPLRVAPVERADAEALGRVSCAGHSLPASLAPLTAALVGRAGWRAYLAWDGAQAAAVGLLRVDGKTAWLGGDATLTTHRGRGAQSALIARRISDAIAAGAQTVVAETNEDDGSSRSYRRAGFKLAYLRESWTLPL